MQKSITHFCIIEKVGNEYFFTDPFFSMLMFIRCMPYQILTEDKTDLSSQPT